MTPATAGRTLPRPRAVTTDADQGGHVRAHHAATAARLIARLRTPQGKQGDDVAVASGVPLLRQAQVLRDVAALHGAHPHAGPPRGRTLSSDALSGTPDNLLGVLTRDLAALQQLYDDQLARLSGVQ